MLKSTTPIIKHIPLFLSHCNDSGLSINTQKNYFRYLNKFLSWIKENKKDNLLPHQLNNGHIQAYSLYLASSSNSLKKVTQNYYLIALRALLSYFIEKSIESLPPTKIGLSKGLKSEKKPNYLNQTEFDRILAVPNIKTEKGLRDRAILEMITSTGLKVNQLITLNRDFINIDTVSVSDNALHWIKNYLSRRSDKHEALFINYRARKSADMRLTTRSVERIVNYYGIKSGITFSTTPEILRWAKARNLSNEIIEINNQYTHNTFTTNRYRLEEQNRQNQKNNKSPAWHIIEKLINQETQWIKDNVETITENYKENPPFMKYDDPIFRKISVLIISGRISATEFISTDYDLWNNLSEKTNLERISTHGKEWHQKMISTINKYFEAYKPTSQPAMGYGRADLGFKINNQNIFVEVGTVSIFKIWYNLSTMKNTIILVVPSKNKLIEFRA